MTLMTVREALRQALDEEMARDENVILLGEEVALYNGAYKISQGLLDKYGPERVVDTPISEEGFTGMGIGAAMVGLRPIVEWMTFNFSLMAFDQIYSNASKMRYMSNGQFMVPAVFRGPNGAAEYLGAQHSQSFQALYAHCPGLKVVMPSTAADAKGLLKTAVRDDNPVMFLESEMMYAWKGEVPDHEFLVPFGQAALRTEGSDITLVSCGKAMKVLLEAKEVLAKQGVSVETIDLRSLRPLDEETLYHSVNKTNRCVIVDEDWPFASVGSHLAYLVAKHCFSYLDAPVELVAMEDVPMPYNHTLEQAALPSVGKIVAAAKRALYVSWESVGFKTPMYSLVS